MIFINGHLFEQRFYPVNEQILEFSQDIMNSLNNKENVIKWKYNNDIEFMTLFFIKKKLDELGIENIVLEVPYLPYARMDRIKETHQFFSLKYVSDFINSLKFSKVIVNDVHSDISLDLISNIENISMADSLIYDLQQELKLKNEDIVIVFPDKTSVKRYSHLKEKYFAWLAVEKVRDFNTGKITSFELIEPEENKNIINKHFVIIDDICSYGGTFIGAMELIKQKYQVKDFNLVVTHLEKSYYDGKLPEYNLLKSVKHANTLDY